MGAEGSTGCYTGHPAPAQPQRQCGSATSSWSRPLGPLPRTVQRRVYRAQASREGIEWALWGAWVGWCWVSIRGLRRGNARACGLEVGACCPGLVALPERIEGQGATCRHLGPWVGRPQQPSHGRAESGHVGAAEGKNRGGGRHRGPRPPGRAGQVPPAGLWSPPRPRLMQAHLGWGTPRIASLGSCTGYPRSSRH